MNRSISHLCQVAETLTGGKRQFTFAPDYAEPGYSSPENGIVFGNWNPVCGFNEPKEIQNRCPCVRLARILKNLGAEIEWEDEWATCCNCSKAIRTQPDSYGWRRSYWQSDEGEICIECVRKNPSDFLEWCEGNPSRALTFDLPLADLGYVRLDADFERGLHNGQDSDPAKIAEELAGKGITRFVFTLDASGQFDARFSVHVHNEQLPLASTLDLSAQNTDGVSYSANLERALRSAALASRKDGECLITKIDVSTGETRSAFVPQPEVFQAIKTL